VGVAQKSEKVQEERDAAASALMFIIIIIIYHLYACYLQNITETNYTSKVCSFAAIL
jgi:hypothetical protein